MKTKERKQAAQLQNLDWLEKKPRRKSVKLFN